MNNEGVGDKKDRPTVTRWDREEERRRETRQLSNSQVGESSCPAACVKCERWTMYCGWAKNSSLPRCQLIITAYFRWRIGARREKRSDRLGFWGSVTYLIAYYTQTYRIQCTEYIDWSMSKAHRARTGLNHDFENMPIIAES